MVGFSSYFIINEAGFSFFEAEYHLTCSLMLVSVVQVSLMLSWMIFKNFYLIWRRFEVISPWLQSYCISCFSKLVTMSSSMFKLYLAVVRYSKPNLYDISFGLMTILSNRLREFADEPWLVGLILRKSIVMVCITLLKLILLFKKYYQTFKSCKWNYRELEGVGMNGASTG